MKTIYMSFKLIFHHDPLRFLYLITSKILQGFIPLLSLLILQRLINSVQQYFEGASSLKEISILLGLQIFLTIMTNVVNKMDEYIELSLQMKLELNIKGEISRKIIEVDYEKLEDHQFYNHIQRTQGDVGSQFMNPVNNILEIGRSVISIITVLGFLMKFHFLFLIILVVFALPLLILQNRFGNRRYLLTKFLTPNARKQNYIFSLFVDRKYNKEIRNNQSFNYLFTDWQAAYKKNTDEVVSQHLDQSKKLVGLELLSSAAFAISFFLILSLLSNSRMRIGDFVSVMEAIQRVLGSTTGLSYMTSNLKESTRYLEDIFVILNFPTKNKKPLTNRKLDVVPNQPILEIKDLNFSYPFSDSPVLKAINLVINPGETVMIVGSNGSGKSTLIKCLIGLYRTPKSAVKLFGEDINLLTENEIYQRTSVIYQDFGTYEMSAYQNILLGDTQKQEGDIVEAAKKADIDEFLSSLPNSYQTKLGRLFEESKELSGGQWQKIAIARALLRESELIILDEPTSSLDAIAEKKLFQKFKEITAGKTSIYISHRMYACHLADRIIVLKDGSIVEKGSHQELMEKRGQYYELYNNQSEMYNQEEQELSYGSV